MISVEESRKKLPNLAGLVFAGFPVEDVFCSTYTCSVPAGNKRMVLTGQSGSD